MAPIRREILPDIAPGEEAEANGAPVADPREEARQVVEDEKIKVLRYQELLLEKREREEARYDPDLDYLFLQVCKNGRKTLTNVTNLTNFTNLTKPKNILINPHVQARVSVKTRQHPVRMHISSGVRLSGHL